MVFESIAAVTAGLSAINSLFNQAKEAQGNFQGIMNGLTSFQDGLQRYEIEKRASLVKPLTPQEALKLSMVKSQMERFHTDLRNMGILSNEHQKFVDEYFRIMAESKAQHEASVRAILEKRKARKQLLHDLFVWTSVSGIGLIIAGIIIALVIALLK